MKVLIGILLIASSFTCRAQEIFYPNPHSTVHQQPVYYVDSVKMDSTHNPFSFINPNSIKDIVIKRNTKNKNGEVHITLKNKKVADTLINDKWLSLKEILNKHVGKLERKKQVLFIWDDKLIVDTTNVRFPAHRITNLSIIKASELPYFKTAFPGVLIMFISTKAPVIYIRGEGKKG